MFQFELHPHIDEFCMDVLVYEKGRIMKQIEAPARVKVELPDLWEKKDMRDDACMHHKVLRTLIADLLGGAFAFHFDHLPTQMPKKFKFSV